MKPNLDSKTDEIMRQGRPLLEAPNLFNIVLIEPEIPQNTGNVGRTCVGTRSNLHIVGETGFKITDRNLKRAGLDYWQHLWWTQHSTMDEWMAQVPDPSRVFYFSTKATQTYFDVAYRPGDWLTFGKETKGLDEDLLRRNSDRVIKIPQIGKVRSLNVATAVAIALYEAIRQNRLDIL
jgi:tRNA (cytidine/uridine-2'-O-)-methyltransferase